MSDRADEVDEALRPVVARLEGLGPEHWRPAAPPPLRHPVPPRARTRRRLVVAVATAAAVALAALYAVRADDARTVALGALVPEARGEAQLTEDAVRVEVELAPSRAGEYYELWTVDGDRVTSLGTFRVDDDGEGSARFTLGVPARGALDVSVEPLDGDPRHSSRSVLRSAPL